MWRARNETEGDIAREERAAQTINSQWGVHCLKLGEVKYRVDWAIFDCGDLVAWAEYKYRNVPKDKYETFMISADKWCHLRWLSEFSGAASMIFVEWADDGIFYINCGTVAPELVQYRYGGNIARSQNGDVEPIAHIPISLFAKV